MTNVKYEGAIQDISPRQLEFIASVLEQHGYNEVTAVIDEVGKVGDNYMASVKRITVEKDGQTFKMVAKVAPTVELLRIIMNTAMVFKNEHVMYTEVLPKLAELEIAAEVPENGRLRYAICYGSFTDELNEIILLEDLKESGFTILDRFTSLTDHEVRLILKSLSKIHGLSYALKYRYPSEFASYRSQLVNIWDARSANEPMKYFYEVVENDLLDVLQKEKHKCAIKDTVKSITDNLAKLKVDENSKHTTIVHGDSWTNNIMFRQEGDNLVETCMIDYQMSRFSVPASDLHYMIFNCTDYETRANHFHDWMDYYHAQLDKCLQDFGLKANFVYSRDQLDADMKRHSKASLGLVATLAGTLTRESTDTEKILDAVQNGSDDFKSAIDLTKSSQLNEGSVTKLRLRMEGVIDSFVDFGYISVK